MSVTINGTDGLVFPDASTQATAASGFGFKNRIINGAMMIDQRNAGASVTLGSAYTLDRWVATAATAGSGAFSVQQVTDAPSGFVNSLKVTTSTAQASFASTDRFLVRQNIEGNNIADLSFGTSAAKTITLSFWVKSSLTGTFGGAYQNNSDRTYIFSYTISSANTWEFKTVTATGCTDGTWLTNTGVGLRVTFSMGAGSSYLATAGSWATVVAAAPQGVTGQTQVISTLNATWQVTGVQLEKGSTATSFDYRPYGTELQLCQRYYEKFTNDARYLIGYYQEGSYIYTPMQFLVEKRATPTIILPSASAFDVWAVGAPSAIATQSSSTRYALIRFTSAGTNYYCYGLLGNASSVFQISSEL